MVNTEENLSMPGNDQCSFEINASVSDPYSLNPDPVFTESGPGSNLMKLFILPFLGGELWPPDSLSLSGSGDPTESGSNFGSGSERLTNRY